MAFPVAQAGSDQAYAYSSLPKLVTLAGSATGGPIIDWEWRMLAVPDGSVANIGVNGDFNNGVTVFQNPQFTCDAPGCYVMELRAENIEGWSIPEVDREGCQTAVFILTQVFSLKIPSAFLYRYDTSLNETLVDFEGFLADHSTRHENGGSDVISVAGLTGLLSTAQNPVAHGSNHKDSGGDEVATATAGANAIPKAGAGGKLDVGWVPTGATSATVCIGNDTRLSDARTPTAHAGSHEGGGDSMTVDAAAGTGSLRTLGTAATSACAGNDARLSDARVPSSHAASHQNPAGGDQINVGGLSGVLADAQNADEFQGRVVAATAPNDGDVYKWNAAALPSGEWQPDTGGGGGGNNMIAMAINENTDSAVDVIVGALGLLDTFLTGLMTKLAVTAYVTAGGLTGSVELYNLTDSTSVAILTFTELISTRKTSASFVLAVGTKVYEIRVKVSGGGSSSDRVVCMWAGIEATVP